MRSIEPRGQAPEVEQKRAALTYLHEAWVEARIRPSGASYFPRNEAVMTAVDAKSNDTFDAVTIIQETNKLANGRLSGKAKRMLAELTSNS